MEKSPQPSPEKVYAPLQVVSPNQSEPSVYSIPPPTLVRPAQERAEQEAVVDTHNPFGTQECSVLPENPEENPESGERPHETQSATPPIASTSALQDNSLLNSWIVLLLLFHHRLIPPIFTVLTCGSTN